MSSNPLVSVIIIFLNAEKFFEEAIESIFAQTYDHWELLLVDDGSTDSSTKIALQYAEQNSAKVRYLEHENHQNRGPNAARNLGLYNAKGKYIALLDADDVWLPEKLERQVAILEAEPQASMVYGSTLTWYSWTGNPEDVQRDYGRRLGVQPDTLVYPPTLVILFMQGKAQTPGTCSVLLRREVIQDIVGGFEESFRNIFEDQVFFYKVCLKAPVFVESGCWDKYRQHPNSSCYLAEANGEYNSMELNPSHLAFLNWLEKYLVQQGIEDTKIWQLLQNELLLYSHPTLARLLNHTQHLKRRMKRLVKLIARRTLPAPIHGRLRAKWHGYEYCPSVGAVNFGNLRRVTPISRVFGYDRGMPIDRYYIEDFLVRHSDDIRGRVLEIGDNSYTQQFGGDRVTKSDVLHVVEGNPNATIIGDLASADHIPSDTFDCLILTQTLHLIYDARAALKTVYRILKPGGSALITFPGIGQISNDQWKDYWYWAFTTLSAQRLFEEVFSTANFKVEAHGNVLAATSLLQGLATQELRKEELDYYDPSYPVSITVRAVKPEVTP